MRPYIITRTGIQFMFDAPTADMVTLADIAYSLSRTPRFLGHTKRFYSVAEHSIRVANETTKRHGDPSLTLEAILHDAEEAYVGDLVAPLKYQLKRQCGDVWNQAIAPVRRAVAKRFGIPEHTDHRVEKIDKEMAATEGLALIANWIPFNLPAPIASEVIPDTTTRKVDIEDYFDEVAEVFVATYNAAREQLQ